jgi:hypothetical protein
MGIVWGIGTFNMNLAVIIGLLMLLGARRQTAPAPIDEVVGGGNPPPNNAPVLDGVVEFIGVEKWRGDLGKYFGIKDRDYFVRVSGYKTKNDGSLEAISVRTPDRDFSNSMQSMMDWGVDLYNSAGGNTNLNWRIVESSNFRRLGAKEAEFKKYWSWTKDLAEGWLAQALGIPKDLIKA